MAEAVADPAAVAAPAAPPPPAAPPAAATALSAGATAPPPVAAPAAAPAVATPAPPTIPDKFIVRGADGAEDFKATALKIAESYGGLEKRLGTGDAPPAAATDYKVNVPESLKGKIDGDALAKTSDFQAFLGKLHAQKLTQTQADAVIATVLERGVAMREAMPVLSAAECTAELRQQDGWKSDAEYGTRMALAFNAGRRIFGADFDGIEKDYGNDPRLIRGLAEIGREMEEDRPPSPDAQSQLQDTLDALMTTKAYLNANDPGHAAAVAKVTALTERMAGTRSVASGRTMSFKSG